MTRLVNRLYFGALALMAGAQRRLRASLHGEAWD
jgi:hypothetical protein